MELPDGRVSACAIYSYAMNDIPAFKEEDFMLSKKNYLSRISLNLKSITTKTQIGAGLGSYVDTKVKSFTKTWEDADKALRLDFLNHQTTKKNFFKKRLPEHLLSEANDLNRATYVYNLFEIILHGMGSIGFRQKYQ